MKMIRSIDSLYNFIGYVSGYAPDRFPEEDYLPADKQMNLERAFDELRHGLSLIDPAVATPKSLENLNHLLDASYLAYANGDEKNGALLLRDFEKSIFKLS